MAILERGVIPAAENGAERLEQFREFLTRAPIITFDRARSATVYDFRLPDHGNRLFSINETITYHSSSASNAQYSMVRRIDDKAFYFSIGGNQYNSGNDIPINGTAYTLLCVESDRGLLRIGRNASFSCGLEIKWGTSQSGRTFIEFGTTPLDNVYDPASSLLPSKTPLYDAQFRFAREITMDNTRIHNALFQHLAPVDFQNNTTIIPGCVTTEPLNGFYTLTNRRPTLGYLDIYVDQLTNKKYLCIQSGGQQTNPVNGLATLMEIT